MLFTIDPYTEFLPQWAKKTVIKALCLHIAHDCNLRCSYCFAGTGEYLGARSLMSLEVGKKAIDFLLENSGGRKNLEVDFFGGEPLMNFNVVKDIVAYARQKEKEFNKNFRFTITTNVLLLDEEKRAFINENMHNVVLSLDGRKEVNDAVRKRVDGTGSYDRILPLAKKMVEERKVGQYYVRGTFTRKNLDFGKDVLHMADLGFDQISVEPVVAAAGSGLDIREEDLEFVNNEYERLAKVKDIFVLGFKDSDMISSELKGHVAIAKGLGIMDGSSEMFSPKENLKMQEAALIIYRALDSMREIK
jgi:uncharacterized protein